MLGLNRKNQSYATITKYMGTSGQKLRGFCLEGKLEKLFLQFCIRVFDVGNLWAFPDPRSSNLQNVSPCHTNECMVLKCYHYYKCAISRMPNQTQPFLFLRSISTLLTEGSKILNSGGAFLKGHK